MNMAGKVVVVVVGKVDVLDGVRCRGGCRGGGPQDTGQLEVGSEMCFVSIRSEAAHSAGCVW